MITWCDLMPTAVSRPCETPSMVHHPGGRLIQGFQAHRAKAEAQIGVLEIRRGVTLVEATHAGENRPLDHQCGAGAIIDFAHSSL